MLPEQRAQVAAVSRRVAAAGLVVASAGNVSMRVGDLVVATPRRVWLEDMQPDLCVVLDLQGTVVEGDRRPSSETPFHLAIYRSTDARAVVHTHSTYATVISTLVDELPPIHYALAPFGGPIRVCEYATFGTDELAKSVVRALAGRQGALLRSHGAVTVGETLDRALERTLVLEWLARVYYLARLGGEPFLLGEAELHAVSAQSRALDQPTGEDG
jgi:L-fuculose-phosphate aldolase